MANLHEALLAEIREKGVRINSINDLIRIDARYRDLVPILLKYLNLFRDEVDKQWIVRCLGAKGFTEATGPLLEEFHRSNNASYKWATGNTLAIIKDRSAWKEMIDIVKDRSHGTARQMIVIALGEMKIPEAKPVLVDLLTDPEVAGHAIIGLAKYGDPSVAAYIAPLRHSSVAWVRKEAEKAIRKLVGGKTEGGKAGSKSS